jgi:cysteine desulfurase / selenocysteine lyase
MRPSMSFTRMPELKEPKTKTFDVARVRQDFPVLSQRVHGNALVYLDNANTTQKPFTVIETLDKYYREYNANIHRATHLLSAKAEKAYEDGRVTIQKFLNAEFAEEIIFVRNATEAVNLVAQTYGRRFIGEGDEILITAMEHHANIVPWQMLCQEKGCTLKVVPIDDDGELIIGEYRKLLSPRTKLVGVTQMSNALGTINPVKAMIGTAHEHGIPVLVDAAQSAYHMVVDVQDLDADFLVFSGHKLYGPTGIGVLYGKRSLLEKMPPWMGGGDMIRSVSFDRTTYAELPYKFEAGTPHIAGVIGLAAAVNYLTELGMDNIAAYEHEVHTYGAQLLASVPNLRLIGTARKKASVFSFVLGDIHAHDIGTILDEEGIAVRTGQHCAHPVMQRFGVPATVRASLACYNTKEELDALVLGLDRVVEIFG